MSANNQLCAVCAPGALHYRCALSGFEESPHHPSIYDELHPTIAWAGIYNEGGEHSDGSGGGDGGDGGGGGGGGEGRRMAFAADEPRLTAIPLRALQARRRARLLKGGSGGGGSGGQSEFDTGEFCDPLAHLQRSAQLRSRGRLLKGAGANSADGDNDGNADRDADGGAAAEEKDAVCAAGSSCQYFDENPRDDVMTFDTFGGTAITILQALTFDDWTAPMFALATDAASSALSLLFFSFIVVIGGFFVVNL